MASAWQHIHHVIGHEDDRAVLDAIARATDPDPSSAGGGFEPLARSAASPGAGGPWAGWLGSSTRATEAVRLGLLGGLMAHAGDFTHPIYYARMDAEAGTVQHAVRVDFPALAETPGAAVIGEPWDWGRTLEDAAALLLGTSSSSSL